MKSSKGEILSNLDPIPSGNLFGWMRPEPHIERLSSEEISKEYPKRRLQVFMSIFWGYATYYLTRSNFPMAAPHLIANFGFSTAEVGYVRSALGLAYGLSKFIMGTVSDRCNPRYFMSIGLILSGITNFLFPVAGTVSFMFMLMLFNGWFQGMGWPPSGRTMTHWFSANERGTKMAIWNVAHNVGGGAVAPVCMVGLLMFGWQGMFYLPGIIAILMGIGVMFFLRDTPQSVGLPPIEEYRNDYPAVAQNVENAEKELTVKEILFKYVLTNKYVWMIALANAFVYCVRYGIVDWSPTYLTMVKQISIKESTWGYFIYEYAGIPGTLLAGWLSDKVFKGRRAPVSFIFMFLTLIAVIVYWKNPAGNPTVDLIALASIGFLIYGPVMLIGVTALDLVPKKAAGTAAGFTGLFGYLFGTVGASAGLGQAVQIYGWDAGFYILIGACVIAMGLLLFSWNVRASSSSSRT